MTLQVIARKTKYFYARKIHWLQNLGGRNMRHTPTVCKEMKFCNCWFSLVFTWPLFLDVNFRLLLLNDRLSPTLVADREMWRLHEIDSLPTLNKLSYDDNMC